MLKVSKLYPIIIVGRDEIKPFDLSVGAVGETVKPDDQPG